MSIQNEFVKNQESYGKLSCRSNEVGKESKA
jgi:hypothetical protein